MGHALFSKQKAAHDKIVFMDSFVVFLSGFMLSDACAFCC